MPQTMTWIDRSTWGRGPWDDEPDRAEWRDDVTGLPCLALRTNPRFGNWCGYVAVPPGHPWHGLDRHEIDVSIRIHGGELTFSESCFDEEPRHKYVCHVPAPGEPADVWWLGFDCGHCFDLMPGMPVPWTIYRTLAYVKGECRSLAAQISAAGQR